MAIPGSKEDFNNFVNEITKELNQLNNVKLYKEFYGETTLSSETIYSF